MPGLPGALNVNENQTFRTTVTVLGGHLPFAANLQENADC